jgi:hypothetical protein
MIIIMIRDENFVAHLDGLGGTPVAHHCFKVLSQYLLGVTEENLSQDRRDEIGNREPLNTNEQW